MAKMYFGHSSAVSGYVAFRYRTSFVIGAHLLCVSHAGVSFVVFFIVNAILWHQDSDGAGAYMFVLFACLRRLHLTLPDPRPRQCHLAPCLL